MKYYKELSEIENESIRLELVTSLVRILSEGMNGSNHIDLQNTIIHIDECLTDINEKLKNKFNDLWDVVREDTVQEEVNSKGKM